MNYLMTGGSLIAVAIAAYFLPSYIEAFTVLNFTVYIIMAMLALSLAFVWGMGGIMVLGHSAFFGLGAYAYAIAALNFGAGWEAVALSMIVPAAFAAMLGYFMFYGRISDIYVGVITLAVTLILFNLVNSTSGPQYKIGTAAIGGYNGITSVPTLDWPNGSLIDLNGMFYLSVGLLIAAYLLLKLYLSTRYGKLTIAIRENERRAELLGYNVSFNKLITFSIGGAVAGLAGCMFANWGAFVSPTLFGMLQSAQIIIWIIVGGRGTLIGPILGCIALQWVTTELGTQQTVNVSFVLGVLLTSFVLLVPAGIASLFSKIPAVFRAKRPGNTDNRTVELAGIEGAIMSSEFILQAKGLGISFGGVHAVQSVDFELRRGELRCLIGPNGAGKTTFFRLLSGQYMPSRGKIIYKGKPLQNLKPYQIARLGIGVKTQVPSLFEALSVYQNLELAANRSASGAEAIRIIEDTLDHIGLQDLRNVPCQQLAHGQRQWVELGQILASKPDVALLDEPAAGMTHSESLKTIEIIKDITQNSSVVVVEHDMDFIKLIGERVTVFDRGSVIAEGTFQEIAGDPHVREAYLGRKEVADA